VKFELVVFDYLGSTCRAELGEGGEGEMGERLDHNVVLYIVAGRDCFPHGIICKGTTMANTC